MTTSLHQGKLGRQGFLCNSVIPALPSEYCLVDVHFKAQVASRIDRLLGELGNRLDATDKQVNIGVAKELLVSEESIRQWRKGVITPRRDKIDALIKYLHDNQIDTTPEYITYGLQKGLPAMELRERIADEGEELELLRIFRSCNRKGQDMILENSRALQLSFPRGSNVRSLQNHRRKRRRT